MSWLASDALDKLGSGKLESLKAGPVESKSFD